MADTVFQIVENVWFEDEDGKLRKKKKNEIQIGIVHFKQTEKLWLK